MKKIIPAPVPPGHKWCFRCAQALPFAAFYADRTRPDGCSCGCRRCIQRKRRETAAVLAKIETMYLRFQSER